MTSKAKTNPKSSINPKAASAGPDFGLVGGSASIQYVRDLLQRIAAYDVTVLIQGESGTGKELVARAIHYHSKRKNNEFVIINCSAFSDALLESELFGHMRGSFTGALAEKKGLFEIADKGTFFLDEVGDMSPALQVKLLRVLQEGVFFKIGGTKPIQVDVRIIAATNQDLQKMVDSGKFRNDLFYRLNVMHINLPALRDRREDIPQLVTHIVQKISAKNSQPVKALEPEVLKALQSYDWPGNIRELENELEKACIMASGPKVEAKDLSRHLIEAAMKKKGGDSISEDQSLKKRKSDLVSSFEKTVIEEALLRTKGNQTQAAKALGISRQDLNRKLKLYQIDLA